MRGSQRELPASKHIFPYLMIISLICLLIPAQYTNKLDQLMGRLVSPFSKGSRFLSVPINETIRDKGSARVSAEDHERLKKTCRRTLAQLINSNEKLLALEKLNRCLAHLRRRLGPKPIFIPAGVAGSDTSILRDIKHLIHDAHSELESGQIILGSVVADSAEARGTPKTKDINAMAVVGRVIGRPGKRTAQLQLLSDPEFRLLVTIKPSRQRKEKWQAVTGTLKGKGTGHVSIEGVPTKYNVQPGDVVLACADPKYLPVAMIIGTVQNCQRYEKNPVLWQIKVRPAADLLTLRDVIIIKN